MKIVAVGHGSPTDMLRAVPHDDRFPGADEVAIEVRAAGVNPKDVKLYATDDYARMRDRSTDFPLALGLEAAGVVTAGRTGRDGTSRPDQGGGRGHRYRVEGAYASRIVVPSSSIVPKPARLSWAQAGSMMLTGTTAFHCLAATAVRPGDTVLVHGAAGAVGRLVTQLATIAGAKVIGTVAAKDVDVLRAWGATPVGHGADLVERVWAAASGAIVAAIDTVGADDAIDASLALVTDRSRIATLVNMARAHKNGFQALGNESGNDEAIKIRDNARYMVAALAQGGVLDIHVDRCLPLADAANAHELVRKGGAGRVILIA